MLKGKTIIELTDVNTGEVEVHEDNNMVTNALNHIFSPFGHYKNSATMFSSSDWLPYYQKLLGGILLFDNTIEEDRETLFAPASAGLVACAVYGTQNDTTNTCRGNFNTTESEVNLTEKYVKYVYDFSTSQGNGNIASVCLTSKNGGYCSYGTDKNPSRYNSSVMCFGASNTPFSFTGFPNCAGRNGGITVGVTQFLFALDPENDIGYYFRVNSTKSISIIKRQCLFKSISVFDTPKPVELVSLLIRFAAKEGVVLDFFSGSSVTAHAVMQLNAEDGGHRKFIMVQLPEQCDENSEAAKAGYKTICEIGKERIRRAGDQILELSLQNLEKEGIVEKYARELPEIRSLEEVYGPSGIGLCLGEEVAEGGNIRSVGSNSQGCGVDSVEHSGGAISGEQGVCPVFENSKGITSGTGNTIVDLRTLKILNENGYRIKLEALGRNQQNDLFADKAFDIKGLSSKLSVLNSDRGFRVLKIDDSNMKDVYYSAGEISQQDLVEQISNIKDGRTDLDLLFGCLVDWGVPLSLPIKTETIENLQVYNVNDGALVACFANDIPEAAIRQIAAAKPLRAVFRDSSFKSDSAKINVTEIFKTISPNTTVKVI